MPRGARSWIGSDFSLLRRVGLVDPNRPGLLVVADGMLRLRNGNDQVRIRLLESDDAIADLTRLLHAAYARLGAMGFNYTAVDQPEAVTRERISKGDCLIAIDAGTIVGTILFRRAGSSKGCPCYERPDVATIGQFGVLPGHQGRGIGGLLLREAERRALSTGANELALDTSEGAHHLIAWYERLGFRSVEYAHWPGKTYRSVIMSKPLVDRMLGVSPP